MKKFVAFLDYAAIAGSIVIFIIIACALFDAFGITDWDFKTAVISFVGSLIGGVITFLGVRLTLKEQRKQFEEERLEQRRIFLHDKYESASYLYSELLDKYISIVSTISETNTNNHHEKLDKLKVYIENMLKVIDDNQEKVMKSELSFSGKIKSFRNILTLLKDYLEEPENINNPFEQKKETLELLYKNIKDRFEGIQKYVSESSDKCIR